MDTREMYDYILDNLMYRFEKVDGKHGKQWCYLEGHSSGRDFFKEIPIQYLSDDVIESIEDDVLSDFEYEYGEVDWEEFHDIFEEVFYNMIDENTGGIM